MVAWGEMLTFTKYSMSFSLLRFSLSCWCGALVALFRRCSW